MKTAIYKVHKQQGYMVQHREKQQLLCITFKWNIKYKTFELLCYT